MQHLPNFLCDMIWESLQLSLHYYGLSVLLLTSAIKTVIATFFWFDSTKTDPNPTPSVNQNAPCESSPNLLVRPNITLTYCYTITHPNRPSWVQPYAYGVLCVKSCDFLVFLTVFHQKIAKKVTDRPIWCKLNCREFFRANATASSIEKESRQ